LQITKNLVQIHLHSHLYDQLLDSRHSLNPITIMVQEAKDRLEIM
jgi:hypothetical protein